MSPHPARASPNGWVQAQHGRDLTTFNEIDMTRVMDLRARFRTRSRKHGVRLGFMSFFARACVLALADVPAVNAEIRGTDIVYHDFVHLGIAAAPPRASSCRSCPPPERLDFAGLEREIARLAQRARATASCRRRNSRRHVHHHERRRVRLAAPRRS